MKANLEKRLEKLEERSRLPRPILVHWQDDHVTRLGALEPTWPDVDAARADNPGAVVLHVVNSEVDNGSQS